MARSMLSPTQRYAAGALLALSLREAQIHQACPLGSELEGDDPAAERQSTSSSGSAGGSGDGDAESWTHESRGLLRPVFRFLEIDSKAWLGLEETAATFPAKHHIGAFLSLIFEENEEHDAERSEQKLALAKAVIAMEKCVEDSSTSVEETCNKREENKQEHQEDMNCQMLQLNPENISQENKARQEKIINQGIKESNQEKVVILYELLSACVADPPLENDEQPRLRKGYDARHRVALRLLATWLDIRWGKVEAMERMVACSAMAAAKEQAKIEKEESSESAWSKWKRGSIIGAAAVTGGTLLAITGGLAAPAIAAGFGALAPTLGTLMPVIGASGFAAIASATGSVAGSVAVAASFGAAGAGLSGSKMARRTGSVEEFEFIPIGQNTNQGCLAVSISISGFVFEKEDFLRPWKTTLENSENYAVQWESQKLIVLSTAIQDWLTSSLAMSLMKQGAMMTVLNSLVTAFAWPATLLSATNFIDSTWAISIDRSDKSGKLMAEVLLKGLQGNRPVTLVGFSLGARVIFKCLQHLSEFGDNEGLVERVVLLGAPISVQSEPWESARRMVAGRFVNVYSTSDWILGVTFRASLLTQGLAGIQPVDIPGVENVDVTDLVDGHSSYLSATQKILEQLELDACFPVFSSSGF
ncbi:transmembrane and coiled-coil domain-containing protein STS1-like [Wolffia australiana]